MKGSLLAIIAQFEKRRAGGKATCRSCARACSITAAMAAA